MFKAIAKFYKTGENKPLITDSSVVAKMYKRGRVSVFLSITLGYAAYYIVRQVFAVVRKPLMDAGIFTSDEVGTIGAVFFFTYMIGKCFNGFLADRLNIKRFMASGLFFSSIMLVFMGMCNYYIPVAILWGLSGWFQTFGAAPSIVSLNQWFSNKERGTFYGIWFSAHNIGTAASYILSAYIIVHFGVKMGYYLPGVFCIVCSIFLYYFMYDRPQVYGLPTIADYHQDHEGVSFKDKSVASQQWEVIKRPAVWIIGLSSASCYITRYAVENWGVTYLSAVKGYSLAGSATVIAISQIAGIFGAFSCGWISDKFFHHRRNAPCLIFGILYIIAIAAFVYAPKEYDWINYASMILFGFNMAALVSYLGGLMAVDICPKGATGATMGVIGLFSYAGASIQEKVSGYLIHAHEAIVDGKAIMTYDFSSVIHFWVISAVVSCLLALFVWNAKVEE